MGSLLPTTAMTTSSGKDSGPTAFQKLASALFYAATSIFLVFVNKSVLTFHHFPAPTVLGIGQMVSGKLTIFYSSSFIQNILTAKNSDYNFVHFTWFSYSFISTTIPRYT